MPPQIHAISWERSYLHLAAPSLGRQPVWGSLRSRERNSTTKPPPLRVATLSYAVQRRWAEAGGSIGWCGDASARLSGRDLGESAGAQAAPGGGVAARGGVQGGPLSPLLAKLLLEDLACELERRGHRFVCYADDVNIYVRAGGP